MRNIRSKTMLMVAAIALNCQLISSATVNEAIGVTSCPYPEARFKNGNSVGELKGDVGSNLYGQATYSIPLEFPVGCGGLTPQLAISYQSSRRNGILGYGFSLEGLSMISRTPATVAANGKVRPIQGTKDDVLQYEGHIMHCFNSSGEKPFYYVESNDVTRIETNSATDPVAFHVKKGDGSVWSYGTKVDSKVGKSIILDSRPTVKWFLDEIVDQFGNFIKFSYYQQMSGDPILYLIEYSGNDNADITGKIRIKFDYESKGYNRYNLDLGRQFYDDRILTCIRVLNEDETWEYKRYDFSYSTVYSGIVLKSIREKQDNGYTSYPATTFAWHNAPLPSISSPVTKTMSMKGNPVTGDFNGDGRTDVLMVDNESWVMYYGSNSTSMLAQSLSGTIDRFADCYVGDFDGDGKDELVVQRISGSTRSYHLVSGFTSSKPESLQLYSSSKETEALSGDFDGDGKADLVIFEKGAKNASVLLGKNGVRTSHSFSINSNWDSPAIVNFDGDMTSDIINITDSGSEVVTGYDIASGVQTPSTVSVSLKKKDEISWGDFNGDGLSDYIYFPPQEVPSGTDRYQDGVVYLGTGEGYRSHILNVSISRNAKSVYTADLNGDGTDEIFTIDDNTSGKITPFFYNGMTLTPEKLCWYSSTARNVTRQTSTTYITGDFTGDGTRQIIGIPADNSWSGFVGITCAKNRCHQLTTIREGLDRTYTISYDNSIRSGSSGSSYPNIAYTGALETVKSVVRSVPSGEYIRTDYGFDTPVVGIDGKGFLGFINSSETDPQTHLKSKTRYRYNPTLRGLIPEAQEVLHDEEYLQKKVIDYVTFNGMMDIKFVMTSRTETDYYSEDSPGTFTSSRIETFSYDNWGNCINHCVTTDGDSVSTAMSYHDLEIDKGILSRLSQVTTTNHRVGQSPSVHTVTYRYNGDFTVPSSKVQSDNNCSDYTESYTYDACGNLTSTTASATGETSRTSSVTYDANKRLKIRYTDPMGYSTSYEFDSPSERMVRQRNPDGSQTDITYMFSLQPELRLDQYSTTVNAMRWVLDSNQDAPAFASYLTYEETTGSSPKVTYYDYDGQKLREVTTTYKGKKVYHDYSYDARGNLSSESLPYFAGDPILYSNKEYDDFNRLTKEITPDGATTVYTYSYDADYGKTTSVTDPAGNTSIKIVNCYGATILSKDADGATVEFDYDSDGNCTTIITPANEIYLTYDGRGNKSGMYDRDAGSYSYTYDSMGNVKTELCEETGIKTTFTYDKNGRLIRKLCNDIPGNMTMYSYRNNSNLVTTVNNSKNQVKRSYTYNALNLVTEETHEIKGESFTYKYSYDNLNRLLTVIYPDRFTIMYNYDESNLPDRVYNMDTKTILWSMDSINAAGQITSQILGNNLTVKRRFDPETGNLTEINNGGINNYLYTYDVNGNMKTRKDKVHNQTEYFKYDNLNRLTRTSVNMSFIDDNPPIAVNPGLSLQLEHAVVPGGFPTVSTALVKMEYDKSGNITSKSDFGDISYISANQIGSVNTKPTAYAPVIWDDIEYTSFNKVSTAVSGTDSLSIFYGVDQNRVKSIVKTSSGAKTTYYPGDLFRKVSSVNYDYIRAGGSVVAIRISGGTETTRFVYPLYDHLNSVVATTDNIGDVVEEVAYDAWGNVRRADDWGSPAEKPISLPMGFCGHEHYADFGMIDMNGRMYDPRVGRFMSLDPMVQIPENVQNLNRYVYCLNNPLKYSDPSGQFFIIDDFVLGFFKGLFTGKNVWKSSWNQGWNAMKIYGGLFTFDSNKSFLGKTWEAISRFSYQVVQTGLGLLYSHCNNTIAEEAKVSYKFGATVISAKGGFSSGREAVTLGSFINGGEDLEADPNNSLFQHEYGHYLQSQAMGWSYVVKVGIPSLISAGCDRISHKKTPWEMDASLRSFIYLNKNVSNNITWNWDKHPIYIKNGESIHVDYSNDVEMNEVRKSLGLHNWWWNLIFPTSPAFM